MLELAYWHHQVNLIGYRKYIDTIKRIARNDKKDDKSVSTSCFLISQVIVLVVGTILITDMTYVYESICDNRA